MRTFITGGGLLIAARSATFRAQGKLDGSSAVSTRNWYVRVQQGDKTAFDLLVRKYQHKVAKLVARYVRDRSEVEDVTQEAFIKAYRASRVFAARARSIPGCTGSP